MPDRPKQPGIIDRGVGERIRVRRLAMGMTPAAFARGLGCEPDLILRYESGTTRVGALALMKLTQFCQVDVGYFLAALGGPDRPPRRSRH